MIDAMVMGTLVAILCACVITLLVLLGAIFPNGSDDDLWYIRTKSDDMLTESWATKIARLREPL